MRTSLLAIAFLCFTSLAFGAVEDKQAVPDADPQLARQVGRAISQLNDDRAAERDAAEKKLLELAGTSIAGADQFLQALPKETDQMTVAVRERLARVRKQVEERAAKAATAATTITLSAKNTLLSELI